MSREEWLVIVIVAAALAIWLTWFLDNGGKDQ